MILFLKVLLGLFVVGFGAWGCLAIWFQIKGLSSVAGIAIWVLITLSALYYLCFVSVGGGWTLLYFVFVLLSVAVWHFIPAKLDRDWVVELEHTVTGSVDGRQVRLENVRDFDWGTGAQDWVSRAFDLDKLSGMDVFLSYWGSPKIAHAIVSFRFEDVDPIAFSVEIRKEKGENYSSIGGFFKKFELAFIAANESDIVALRTNYRDPIEDVYLFPLVTKPEEREALFLGYIKRANKLAKNPAWYHTISANCTTVIFDLVRQFRKEVKLDKRILLSGLLPELFAEREMIDHPKPYGDYRAKAAITAKGQKASGKANYSAAIRK
jgi:hypothetical protein